MTFAGAAALAFSAGCDTISSLRVNTNKFMEEADLLGKGQTMLMHYEPDEVFLAGMKGDAANAVWVLPKSLTHIYHTPIAQYENNFKLFVDVFYRDKQPPKPRPALIFLHDWASGKQPQMAGDRQCSYLALMEDVFCAVLYYRQPMDARFPAALQDVKCAIRWLRCIAGEYNIASDQVIVMGSSAGSQWTWLAAATNDSKQYGKVGGYDQFSDNVNMAIVWSSICNFVTDFGHSGIGPVIMGGTAEEMPEQFREASPLERLHAGMPPVLMIHGDLDASCPVTSALTASGKLKQLGVPCEILIRKGSGHDLAGPDSSLLVNLEASRQFIRTYFK